MFSTETQQALRALVALAAAHGPVVLDTLANEARAPAPALAKILARLARSGLVVGQRGPGGGYRLGRPADTIRLIDVITPIQGTAFARTCLFGLPHCSDEAPCPLHATWGAIRDGLFEMVEHETLATLSARSKNGTRPMRADDQARNSGRAGTTRRANDSTKRRSA